MSKTWTKAEIIKKVAEETGFQRKEAHEAVSDTPVGSVRRGTSV